MRPGGWLFPARGGPENGPDVGASMASLAAWCLGVTFVTGYVMFQKRMLPPPVARVAAKVYFWPTMPFTIVSRWDNYWTQMDESVYLGAAPLSVLGHVGMLQHLGIGAVVNLCAEYEGPVQQYQEVGIEQLWLPTLDHTEPSVEDLQRGVAFIEDFERKQSKKQSKKQLTKSKNGVGPDNDAHSKGQAGRGKVLVHCKAGHGRSAALVMAWLLAKEEGATPKQVQADMLGKRKVRKRLFEQRDVRAFYQGLAESGDGGDDGAAAVTVSGPQ